MCSQNTGCRQKHRHVHVVTAHVRHVGRFAPHLSFCFAFECEARVFLYRQGVYIRSQADGVSFLGINDTDNSGGRVFVTHQNFVHTEFLELLNDVGLGLLFLVAEFRIGMQVATHFHSISGLGTDSHIKPRRSGGKGACCQKRQAGKGKNAQCFIHRSAPLFSKCEFANRRLANRP